jgi:O-acetyl-ADP-ribose deacetylase (regulator of RNase III)
MLVKVVLCDINPKMIAAWKDSFEENPEVDVIQGSMLDQQCSAYVTPTNAKASMDGGLDGVLKRKFGQALQTKVQAEVKKLYNGHMKVGQATCVESGADMPKYIISTPTMAGASDDISNSLNVALTCCAAFQMVHIHNNAVQGGSGGSAIRSVALPGLGTGTGRMPVEIAADLMWTAYNLFREKEFKDFDEMKKALEEILGDLGEFGDNMAGNKGHAKIAAATAAINAPAPAPLPDEDADDFDDADDEADEDEEDFDDH